MLGHDEQCPNVVKYATTKTSRTPSHMTTLKVPKSHATACQWTSPHCTEPPQYTSRLRRSRRHHILKISIHPPFCQGMWGPKQPDAIVCLGGTEDFFAITTNLLQGIGGCLPMPDDPAVHSRIVLIWPASGGLSPQP